MFVPFLLAALAAGPVDAPASGQDAAQSIVVRSADLDLASARDRARLERRIARAAEAVCRPESTVSPELVSEARRCVRETVAASRVGVGPERLAAAGR